jgi:hypothetical protein
MDRYYDDLFNNKNGDIGDIGDIGNIGNDYI